MNNKKLQVTLYILGTYQTVFAIMVIVAPDLFQRITRTTLSDDRITLLYASYLLIFGLVSYMAAREKEAASKLSLTTLLVSIANILVFGFLLIAGRVTFGEVAGAMIANVILAPAIFFFRRQPRIVG